MGENLHLCRHCETWQSQVEAIHEKFTLFNAEIHKFTQNHSENSRLREFSVKFKSKVQYFERKIAFGKRG